MKLSEKIRYVGVNDTTTELFESQWPLPFGVSYNSYLIIDKKIALIDTAAALSKKDYLDKVQNEVGDRAVDYLIVNHMEPDHSALQADILALWPNCKIVTNAKAVPMIEGFNGLTENIQTISEGETLSLGETSLQFFMVPMVHWPETMVTWCPEEKTLFSGDAFGSFKTVTEDVTDAKKPLFDEYSDEMTRYYSNIVGKYGQPVRNAIKKLEGLKIERICSTHGPVWENEIGKVVALYNQLSGYETSHGVCIAYGSMYGNTEKAALELKKELDSKGITCVVHNLSKESYSFALRDVFKYDTIVLGSPTYNNGIFPPVRQLMEGICDRLVKNRKFLAFGSYTWAAAAVKLLTKSATDAGFEILSEEGFSFKQGFNEEKCNIKAIADLIR